MSRLRLGGAQAPCLSAGAERQVADFPAGAQPPGVGSADRQGV